ncbi:conserved Plasmodium protein, unknown function [Plasmodium knowlesi strain H]|uniref:Uncharacterized protein n=3 Tax=Plasmodium knowlesi TaxID=5850 RepID=A0A5K1VDH7_PLAKH|nr:conserved Plasmodium protein, unknown function [Plasmodium knowlesi strain H]OTN66613.1 Uncharacterized protein PKNOH_S08505400 [Plasmodium knowlesi]CAA9986677.1 conserved Plasmodium protein, unknown function [Plasmodium knowlesi strain H]SBO23486.1 conserved Plasmodium protein, unknown function [Plasmodium knowlesi strain H]SBO24956.1 conserved Plasmodium protein, unknown function [Plasmodium knowlesi strain H]VVS76151.1 conserved Plasmodium protein, unknown function [Plasmodium knowlesi s|eukprot:XP_002257863.1 hypothetical protein, conserved in Plasmodium species [Plasmodium knowlesi strain H]
MQIGCRGASVGARQALRTQRKKQQAEAISQYVEKLEALSKHEKIVRIDLNGKEKKACKYFFQKNKYVYVKSKEQIERFDRGSGQPISGALPSSATSEIMPIINIVNNANATTTARERRWRQSEKALRDTYDLSQEEMLYMKFIEKIKMKNIYSLLNNIRKNKYINKNQRDTILNCIYKYISRNCYLMPKKNFLFFLHIFPQQIKHSSRAVHYLKNLLDKDEITLTECLRLISEINLYHVNYHVRGNYIHFIIRHAEKISFQQILRILSKGCYLFAITPDFKKEEELLDHVLKNKLLQIVKETNKVPLDGDLKWDYLHYMEWCARRENIYLHLLFNDLSVQLHRKIFIENIDTLKRNHDYEYLQRVLTLGRYNLCINHLNNIFLNRDMESFHRRGKTTKVKILPSYITEGKMKGENGYGIVDEISEKSPRNAQEENESSKAALLPCDDSVRTTQFYPEQMEESNTLKKMKLAFSFSTAFEKLKSNQYDQLKQTYQINTKITDKNVKILLKFLRMLHHHNNSSHLDNLFCRDNLPQIVSDLRREGKFSSFGRRRVCKTDYGENSPLWRLTHWWNSDQLMNFTDKQIPSFYDLFGHTEEEASPRGEIPPIRENPLLQCKVLLSKEITLLSNPEIKELEKKHNKEENISSIPHPSNSIIVDNLLPTFQTKDTISCMVKNIYFNEQYSRKCFYKSQLNCLAKSLLYMSNSFVQYHQMSDLTQGEVNPRWKNNLLLAHVERTFYEIFTYVMKNVYLINISNWFHIFIAMEKFGKTPSIEIGKGGERLPSMMAKPSEQDTLPTNRMKNLLQIVYTLQEYRYQEVRTIVEEEDTRRGLQIVEFPFLEDQSAEDDTPDGDTPNFDTLHRCILNKFKMQNEGVITARKEPTFVPQETHNLGEKIDTESPTVKYTYEMGTPACMINLQCAVNFLLSMISNYLDGASFQTKRFLIILYHLNGSILKDAAIQAHLETRLHRNHLKFRNRYFYIHTGCGRNQPTLEKSVVAKIRASKLALKGGSSPGSNGLRSCLSKHTKDLQDNHMNDLYTQIEKLFNRNKNCFTLDDMITFIVTYSLNGLYHSTIYFTISKWLLRHDLTSVPDEIKIFLFILFGQCTHVYKPLYFYLLRLVLQIKIINEHTTLPLLCAFLHMLINHDDRAKKVRLKHLRYVERKFSLIHWPYFFPMELFLLKSAQKIASGRISTLENHSISDQSIGGPGNDTKTSTTRASGTRRNANTCEKMNSRELTLNLDLNMFMFEEYLKDSLPQIFHLLEKCSVGGQDQGNNTAHGEMPPHPPQELHLLDEEAHQLVLQNCKNFLSYYFVQRNFLISRRSLYYSILVHLQRKGMDRTF